MTNKLEKVLELLVNEREKEASALLHEWFVEKAREIHTKLVEEEDLALSEDDLENDVDAEKFYEDGEEVEAEGEDEEVEEEGDDFEEQLKDLQNDVEELKAEFEKLLADSEEEAGEESEEDMDMEVDVDSDEDMDMDMDMDSEEEVEEAVGVYGDPEGEGSHDAKDFIEPGMGDDDGVYEDEELELTMEDEDLDLDMDDEDFEDLEESAMALLQTVKNQNTESEVGAGKKVNVNTKSPVPQHPVEERAKNATPLNKINTEYARGFEMEDAPDSEMADASKTAVNVRRKGRNFLHNVPKGGDASALLNKVEGGAGNTVSPVPTRGKKK